MRKEELKEHLLVLGVNTDIEEVNIKEVNRAFRKLAKKVHPDKAGDEKTAAFQRIKYAYDELKKYLEVRCAEDGLLPTDDDSDDEERFFVDNFDKFNYPFENNGSFTVGIEDWLADTWQTCLSDLLGEPKIIRNDKGTECDRFWKSRFMGIDVTVHIWNNPKNKKGSKLMIQGSRQSIICSYVFEELPKIYKLVRLNKPEAMAVESKNTRKNQGRAIVKCDQCKFKSSMLQMKMHIKTVHGPKPQRSKRTSNFTPRTKPAKKSKSNEPNLDMILSSEGIIDNSFLLVDNEGSFIENQGLLGVEVAPPEVEIKSLITCSKCEFDSESSEDMKEHVNKIHIPFECLECSFTSDENTVLKEHESSCKIRTKQIEVPEVIINASMNTEEEPNVICGVCSATFKNTIECMEHMTKHPFTCYKCEFQSSNQNVVKEHELSVHTMLQFEFSTGEEMTSLHCKKCKYSAKTETDMNRHIQTEHMHIKVGLSQLVQKVPLVLCDECDYSCRLNIQMRKHKRNEHVHEQKHACSNCSYVSNFIADMWEHTIQVHPEKSYQLNEILKRNEAATIKIVAEQNADILEEFETFKKDTKGAFDQLANVIADVFEGCINKVRDEAKHNHENILEKITQLYNIIKKEPDEYFRKKTGEDKVPEINEKRKDTKRRPSKVSSFNSKPKVLYAADSVGHSASAKILEEYSGSRIKTVRAYSSVYDEKARWPERNFTDVVKANLENPGREPFDVVVMAAPTVDITNLDTSKLQQSDSTEVYQQNVVVSAQNMFSLAEHSLEQNPQIQQVVIMEHPPRFDIPENDPLSLKSSLANLANLTLNQLWLNSTLKNKIFIGKHSLDSTGSGPAHEARFVSGKSGRYDGVHYYGPRGGHDYTQSVKTILMLAKGNHTEFGKYQESEHKTCPQALYQMKQKIKTHQSVTTQNRFSIFNQGNL